MAHPRVCDLTLISVARAGGVPGPWRPRLPGESPENPGARDLLRGMYGGRHWPGEDPEPQRAEGRDLELQQGAALDGLKPSIEGGLIQGAEQARPTS